MSTWWTGKWKMFYQQYWENTASSGNALHCSKHKINIILRLLYLRVCKKQTSRRRQPSGGEGNTNYWGIRGIAKKLQSSRFPVCQYTNRLASERCRLQPLPVNWPGSLGTQKHNWQLQISKLGPIFQAGADRAPHLSLLYSIQASPISKQCFPPSLSPFLLFCSAFGCDYTEEICQFVSGCCWLVHLGDDELVIEMEMDDGMKKRWASTEKEQQMAIFFSDARHSMCLHFFSSKRWKYHKVV